MNKTYLTGYISSDLELKTTVNGTYVLSFQLAVKRPHSTKGETDFFTIVCWGKEAEFVSKHFKKGSGIEVSRFFMKRRWKDNDGNPKTVYEMVAEDIDFGKKSKVDLPPEAEDSNLAPSEESFEEIPEDELMPF